MPGRTLAMHSEQCERKANGPAAHVPSPSNRNALSSEQSPCLRGAVGKAPRAPETRTPVPAQLAQYVRTKYRPEGYYTLVLVQ